MTIVVTERVKDGVNKAIKFLEKGDSIRRACKKAGISVTSLYNYTTPEQRDLANPKDDSATPPAVPMEVRKRGRKPRAKQQVDESDLQRQLQEANEYIYKLERKLLKTVVLNDTAH